MRPFIRFEIKFGINDTGSYYKFQSIDESTYYSSLCNNFLAGNYSPISKLCFIKRPSFFCELLVQITPYLVILLNSLSLPLKRKLIDSPVIDIRWQSGIFLYRMEKSNVETELA